MDAPSPGHQARRDRVLANPFLLDMPVPALRALPADWINDVAAIGATALDRVADVQNPLIHQVRAALEAGERPVVIGADCQTPIAVVAGLSRAGVSPRVLWLDAHGDFNTPTTSPSGFLGGMPLAMLVGRGDRRLLEAAGLAPLSERDVVLFDARDLDPAKRSRSPAAKSATSARLPRSSRRSPTTGRGTSTSTSTWSTSRTRPRSGSRSKAVPALPIYC